MTRGTVENILLVRENPENQQRVSGKNFYFSLSLVTGVQVFVRNFRGGIGGDSKQKVSPFRDGWGEGGGISISCSLSVQSELKNRKVEGKDFAAFQLVHFFFVSEDSFYLIRNNCDGKCQLLPLRGAKFVINKWRRFRRASPMGNVT